ncbi:Ribose methyltransferase, partial [Coemansia brasiliensis]
MNHDDLEGSELIYGLAPVMAVLQQGKRKVHSVFLQKTAQRDIARPRLDEICKMAKEQNIPIVQRSRKFMDNASADGSHQGVAVQAGPLGTPEILEILGA